MPGETLISAMAVPPEPSVKARLQLRLIGQMRATTAPDGASVLPRVRKTRGLLAILAVASPGPVLREELTALLWSQRDREQARASLRQAVHDLQDHLVPAGIDLLVADRNHISLAKRDVWIDIQAVARATVDAPEALALIVEANPSAGLLRDLIGVDPAFDRWIAAERQRLLRGAIGVAEAVLAAAIGPDVIPAINQILSLEPTHEGAWRAMMRAHAAAGDRAAAIAAFQHCSAALAEAAQIEPSAETHALLASIRSEARLPVTLPARSAIEVVATSRPHKIDVRLGVLPFRLLDQESDPALSLGLAEEITTALSRFRHISLIASPSLAAIGGADPAATATLRSLDLDFVVDGTVQRSANRLRVTVRLLDTRAEESEGAEVIWARRFDRDASDLLTLQDEIAAEAVAQIDPELLLREGRRASSQMPRDASAYDLLLRAIPAIYRLDEHNFRAAGDLLAAAVALEPDFAAAHAWWAYWHVFLVGQGWATDSRAAMLRAGKLAERALSLDPTDARAVTIAGHVRAFLHQRIDEAIALHERALSLNPNLPLAWVMSGLAHVYAGHHDEAVRRIEQARRLSPFDPHSFFFDMAMTLPQYLLGRYEVVVELGRKVTAMNPTLSSTYKGYLAALGRLVAQGDAALAIELVAVRERLLQIEPGFCIREALGRSPLQRAQDRAAYAQGLHLAGLAEHPGDADDGVPWHGPELPFMPRSDQAI